MTYGEMIHARRKELGLTLEQVARSIRSHKGYVSGIENGKVNPPSATITTRLSKALGLDLERLLIIGHAEKAPKKVRGIFLELLEAYFAADSDARPVSMSMAGVT